MFEGKFHPSEMDNLYLRGDVHKDEDVNEETGDYKHNIPQKKPTKMYGNDGIRLPHAPQKSNKVRKVPERNALQRRLTPGLNTAREILHISYPKPKFNLHFFKNMSFSEPMLPISVHKLPLKIFSHIKPSHPVRKPNKVNSLPGLLFNKHTQPKTEKNLHQLGDGMQQFSGVPEIKEPFFQLERQKLIEDIKKKEKLIQNFFNNHLENCKRNGDCKPPNDYYKNTPANINIAAMFPRATNSLLLPQHLPMHRPLINSVEVLSNFPELRANGITEEVLQSLAEHIPDLEKRIYAHFAMKNNMLLNHENELLHQNDMWQQNDLAQSNLAFMKNYKDYLTYMNQENSPESEISAGLLPDQHRVNEALVDPEMPYNNPWNTATPQSFVEQEQQNLLNQPPQNEQQPLPQENHFFQNPQQYFSNNVNQETLAKPPDFENPCTRSGECNPNFPNVGLSEQYAYKNPLVTPHSSNEYRDNTKYTPDELLPAAPDPRFVEYYNKYMEGKSMEDDDAPLRQRPPPILQPSNFLEQSQMLSFSLPPPPPPPPLPPPPPPPLPPPPPPLQMALPLSSSPELMGMPIIESSVFLEQLTTPQPDVQAAYNLITSSDDSSINDESGDWTPYSVCSTTCGRGEKKRFRRCSVAECPSGSVEVESAPCALDECPGMIPTYIFSFFIKYNI